MRSRYVAFALSEISYLLDTSHPTLREQQTDSSLRESTRGVEWCGLEILEIERGAADDDEGSVKFVASCREGNRQLQHHELAHFIRSDGVWLYERGDAKVRTLPARAASKVGRNSPCPCGSGEKYKRCCAR
jgi:SEC-C motif-containing protein